MLCLEHLPENPDSQSPHRSVLVLHVVQQQQERRLEVLLPVALLRVASRQSVDRLEGSLPQLGAGGGRDTTDRDSCHTHGPAEPQAN